MILILPIDQNDGLAFNQRRQSRDKVLCQRVLELAGGKPLLMHPRSARLFLDFDAPLPLEYPYVADKHDVRRGAGVSRSSPPVGPSTTRACAFHTVLIAVGKDRILNSLTVAVALG